MAFGSLPSVLGSGGGTAYSLIGGTGLFSDGTAAAPSISFASQTNKGFYSDGSNTIGLSTSGAQRFQFGANQLTGAVPGGGFSIQHGASAANFTLGASGNPSITAAGTNQNITLTPSGTGKVVVEGSAPQILTGATNLDFAPNGANIGISLRLTSSGRALIGTTTDSGALLQVGANAATGAALAGMSFGGDTFIYRIATGQLTFDCAGDSYLILKNTGTTRAYLGTEGTNAVIAAQTASLVLKSANTTALTLDSSQNATFAATVAIGQYTTAAAPAYAKGKLYFDATLNKLRVGGATAWETVTSV